MGHLRVASAWLITQLLFLWWLKLASFGVESGKGGEADGRAVDNVSPGNDDGITHLLIARTVSPAEVETVVADIKRINSYKTSNATAAGAFLAESVSNCDKLRDDAPLQPDVFATGSASYPNRLLCRGAINRTGLPGGDDNFASVKADFLLFARDQQVVETINGSLADSSADNVDIIDVSDAPKKLWNWIVHLSETRLSGYDYLWLVDGDIRLKSLNWQALWQQVKLIRPKISQPSIIGEHAGGFSSGHWMLQHQADSRVMASETAIIELMAPLIEVKTWLGYHNIVSKNAHLLTLLKGGGETCFDLGWCHYARHNMTGYQAWPARPHLTFDPNAPTINDESVKHRSCVVLYQTPMVHVNKRTLSKDKHYNAVSTQTCLLFKHAYHTKWAVRSVYDLFISKA